MILEELDEEGAFLAFMEEFFDEDEILMHEFELLNQFGSSLAT